MARSGAGWAGRLRRSGLARAVMARLGAGYVRLVHATTRWQVSGAEHRDRLAAAPGGFIAAFWHGRLFLAPMMVPAGREGVAMISNNRDGALITAVAARFGARAVRGSSFDRRKGRAKGAATAYRAALAELARPATVLGVTPDGPRGPRERAQAGVAHLSIAAGCPVLPAAFATRRAVRFGSWDRFLLPLPFGRGAIVYGPPLMPPAPGDATALERHHAAIEAALAAATAEADRLCGRPGPVS